MVDGEKAVRIHGEIFPVKAEVVVVDAFSGHADRSDLMTFVSNIKGLKRAFIVHGEEKQAQTFSDILNETHPEVEVSVPSRGEGFVIDPKQFQ